MGSIKYQRRQQVVDNLILYLLTPLLCTLFCSSPLWFPPLFSYLTAFLLVTLPDLASVFMTSKSLFILGNLIVVILVRESKIFASNSSSSSSSKPHGDGYYDEYVTRCHSLKNTPTIVDTKEVKLEDPFIENVIDTCEDAEKMMQEEEWAVEEEAENIGEEEVVAALPAEDLNRRADDFIARVNKQRRLEATLLICTHH